MNDRIGRAYRLVDCGTGRTLPRLISGDILKKYAAERVELEARLPTRMLSGADDVSSQPSDPQIDCGQALQVPKSVEQQKPTDRRAEPNKASHNKLRAKQQTAEPATQYTGRYYASE